MDSTGMFVDPIDGDRPVGTPRVGSGIVVTGDGVVVACVGVVVWMEVIGGVVVV
ncbi:hypothetical protein ES707_19396 [subsurface metagenome]